MKKSKAFLLFEVLVSILIASTVLVIIMQGLGNSLRGKLAAENYYQALLLAETRMALLEQEESVEPGTESGRFSKDLDEEEIFTWEQKITPLEPGQYGGAEDLSLCEVVVIVKMKEKSGERQVSLVTYLPEYEESAAER